MQNSTNSVSKQKSSVTFNFFRSLYKSMIKRENMRPKGRKIILMFLWRQKKPLMIINPNVALLLDLPECEGGWFSPHQLDHQESLWKNISFDFLNVLSELGKFKTFDTSILIFSWRNNRLIKYRLNSPTAPLGLKKNKRKIMSFNDLKCCSLSALCL